MYNQEIKDRFFVASPQHEKKRRYLEKLSQSEESFGMDICQMTRTQAIEAIRILGGYDLGTFNTLVSSAKCYARWCFDNGIFPESSFGILGVSPSDINPQEYIKKFVFPTEESLVASLSKYAQIYDGDIEVIACIFAWLGIDDPVSIRDSDVFLEGRKIMQDGVVVVDGFSDFIADFLESYKKLRTSTRENGTTTYTTVKDRSHDTFIKRFCSPTSPKMGIRLDLRTVQSAIHLLNNKCVEDCGIPKITYRNIQISGALSRLYAAEQKGLRVFDKENEETVERFFSGKNYRSITWLYKHYKAAFNL